MPNEESVRPRPVVVAGPVSSTARRIVEGLRAEGAEAYYRPDDLPRHALVLRWSSGGDKLFEAQRLTAAGVPVPRYSVTPVAGWIPRRGHHMQARDFTNPPLRPDFWTEPVYAHHEFRVHVLFGEDFRTQLKTPPEEGQPLVMYGVPIRNHRLGWKFSPSKAKAFFPESVLRIVQSAAVAAVEALRYDIGAVDIGLIETATGPRPVVFEVNTRPDMDERTLNAYVRTLQRLSRA